jgi:hypothetical protein
MNNKRKMKNKKNKKIKNKDCSSARCQWLTPIIQAFCRRQRSEGLQFKTSLSK